MTMISTVYLRVPCVIHMEPVRRWGWVQCLSGVVASIKKDTSLCLAIKCGAYLLFTQ